MSAGLVESPGFELRDLADTEPRLRRCGWCRDWPTASGTIAVVWLHPDVDDCWCQRPAVADVVGQGENAHVSWSCAAHLERELDDLRSLDLLPVATIDSSGGVTA